MFVNPLLKAAQYSGSIFKMIILADRIRRLTVLCKEKTFLTVELDWVQEAGQGVSGGGCCVFEGVAWRSFGRH
jgi:hypothetical protein